VGEVLNTPGGVGNPGWSTGTSRIQFKNGEAPGGASTFRSITLRQGRQLKLNGKETGLLLLVPLTAVGVRITTGSLVNCARFAINTVTKSTTETFIAHNAPASALADCSNASLGGVPVTTTTDGPDGSMLPTTTTTTTLPGTCGDNVINQFSEQCDGTDSAFCEGFPGGACGPAGYPTGCQCCVLDSVPAGGGEPYCCDPAATVVFAPTLTVCTSTHCNEAFDCTIGTCQTDGSCCAAVGAVCGFEGSGGSSVMIPCCNPAAVCAPAIMIPPFVEGKCCLPGGIGCSADGECCSGTCASGTCAP
jgi:hypothetical protein